MFGSAEVTPCICGGLYDYTIRALPGLMPALPMHPDTRESNLGAQTGNMRNMHQRLGPSGDEAEAREPDPLAPESEAIVSLVNAEEVAADTEFAAASVGLCADCAVDGLPEASES